MNASRLRLKGDREKKRCRKMSLGFFNFSQSVVYRKSREKERESRREEQSDQGDVLEWVNIRTFKDLNGPIVLLSSITDNPSALNISSQGTVRFTELSDGSSMSEWIPGSTAYVFLPTRISKNQFTLRTPVGNYIGVDSTGGVMCERNAAGQTEIFELLNREDGFALETFKGYLSCNSEGAIRADSDAIGSQEVFTIKTQRKFLKKESIKKDSPIKDNQEELKSYVMPLISKYQSSSGSKGQIITPSIYKAIKKARVDGYLHETLLDIREKSKSDKVPVRALVLIF